MTERKHLYCCSSYYQLLVSLMKALTQGQKIDLVLEEHGIETAAVLAGELERSESPILRDCVDRVFVCPDSEKTDPYIQRCAAFVPWQRREILHHMDRIFAGTDIGRKDIYERIHVFWDLGYAGTYCNIRKIHYTLHEDSLNSYQHIKDNRKNYSYIFQKHGLKFCLKKYFHTGVIPFGYSDCCDVVEVNDKKGIEIPLDKVTEIPRKELEKQLTLKQKKAIFDVFTAGMSSEGFSAEGAVLILTEPFAVTGRLPDEEAQFRLYQDMIEDYAQDSKVLIKAHPRDSMDYRKYFPDAEVMEKNIPMEILNFDENFRISRAVTVTSSVIQGLSCVDEKIYLGAEFLHKYKR